MGKKKYFQFYKYCSSPYTLKLFTTDILCLSLLIKCCPYRFTDTLSPDIRMTTALTPHHQRLPPPLKFKRICNPLLLINIVSYHRKENYTFSIFHFCIRGGIIMLIYSGLLRCTPTLSARVPIASYRIRRFLC
jgi:hypothetical protein